MNTTPAKVDSTHLGKHSLQTPFPRVPHLTLIVPHEKCVEQLTRIVRVLHPDHSVELRIILLSRTNPLGLTVTELKILHLLIHGKTTKQIALQLGPSHRTVQKHI